MTSQRSERKLTGYAIVAAGTSAFHQETITPTACLYDYLPLGSWVAMVEPVSLTDRARAYCDGFAHTGSLYRFEDIASGAAKFTLLEISAFGDESAPAACYIHAESASDFPRDLGALARRLEEIVEHSKRATIFFANSAEEARLKELLAGENSKALLRCQCLIGHINQGFTLPDIGMTVLSSHELFSRYRQRHFTRPRLSRPVESLLDLRQGDYVVHVTHGIGRFLGLKLLEKDERVEEHLVLQYAESAKLYVPASHIDLVQKYIGMSVRPPRLSKLGAKGWQASKEKVSRAVRELALELIEVQAVRMSRPGIAYPEDIDWQRQFEAEFIYQETEDQLQVLAETKQDMQSERPMDRLICGDVGYGKTELAMRAAFKAVNAGKQVAVLVPTTVLAQQHYQTFSERMVDYPIVVEQLSRFKTKSEQKDIIARLEAGQVDIVIGTHRLIQNDVGFRDLGLVIIDEEQRFGVEHKERLKRFRQIVDVLTLTATPIPRTLHMSLIGVKDISTLATPPQDRQSIRTQITPFKPQRVREAILRELNRDGQVYFVHNRVYNIDQIAAEISRLVPEAQVAIAHGQMREHELEKRMTDFVAGKINILVCTTIIESGLDIPNVNTIFVHEADQFGLADLHQLRGRVGRYKHRAYAYFLLPRRRPVTPTAERRLKAIEDYAQLGAGFDIAMRDLEIRGAGNILGPEQSGHIAAVGYEMYRRLLEIAIRRLKGEAVPPPTQVYMDLQLKAFLPTRYVPGERERMDIYRRLAAAPSEAEIADIASELQDRFGPPLEEVKLLLEKHLIRLKAQALGIKTIVLSGRRLVVQYRDWQLLKGALGTLVNRMRRVEEDTLHLLLNEDELGDWRLLAFLKSSLQAPGAPATVSVKTS